MSGVEVTASYDIEKQLVRLTNDLIFIDDNGCIKHIPAGELVNWPEVKNVQIQIKDKS